VKTIYNSDSPLQGARNQPASLTDHKPKLGKPAKFGAARRAARIQNRIEKARFDRLPAKPKSLLQSADVGKIPTRLMD